MKRLSLIAVALVACMAVGFSGIATAGPHVKKVKSKISLAYTPATITSGPVTPYDPYKPPTGQSPGTNNKNASFHGKVTSKKKVCRKKRKVLVKNVDTKSTFGKDKTNRKGKYRINAGAGAAAGTYRAKVKKKVIKKKNGNKIVCKRAKSGKVTVL